MAPPSVGNNVVYRVLTTVLLDVTDDVAIAAATRRHTEVNVLVNCAGFVASGSILTASREDLDRTIA